MSNFAQITFKDISKLQNKWSHQGTKDCVTTYYKIKVVNDLFSVSDAVVITFSCKKSW